MAKIKINGKNYEVPKLGFGHMEKLESEGYDIVSMMRKKQIFAPVSAFIMLCVGCDREEANRLAEQHVYGGGNMVDIYNAFVTAMQDSVFFRKILQMGEADAGQENAKKSEPKAE